MMADKITIDYYNSKAEEYGNVAPYPDGHFVGYRTNLARRVKPGGRILDLGCGGGHAALAFIESGFELVALDGSIELASIASRRTGLDVIVKDFVDLDYDSEFDGVWAAASLTHLRFGELSDVFRKVFRALRPAGSLVASFKLANEDWRDKDGRLFGGIDSMQLESLCKTVGFGTPSIETIEDRDRSGYPQKWAWVVAQKVSS